jgi:beta-lactamase regulating signal transducer with metallopeptidase domain
MTAVLNVLLEITLYSAVICGAVLLFKRIFGRHISAALNYAVWALLILRLLLPVTLESGFHFFAVPQAQAPVAQAVDSSVPDRTGPVWVREEPALPIRPAAEASAPRAADADTAETGIAGISPEPAAPARPFDWKVLPVAIWALGAFGLFCYMAALWFRLSRSVKRGGEAPPEYVLRLVEACRADLGIKAKIQAVVHEGFSSPSLSTSLSPRLLLPRDALLTMDAEQLEFAVRHELTHYRRKDHLVNLLLILLRCVYWFNPVVWLAFRQIETDMEAACDASVTSVLEKPARMRYIGTILELGASDARYTLGMGMSRNRRSMEKRLKGIFMAKRTKLSVRMAGALLAGAILIACFTTACQPTPEKPVVVNKSKDLVEEVKNAETASPSASIAASDGTGGGPSHKLKDLVIPDGRYTFKSENEKASLKIDVDAEIVKPEGGKMPFAKVKQMDFTQEMVTGMFNYLFPDQKPYLPREQLSKSELEKELIRIQKQLAEGKAGGEPLDDSMKKSFEQDIKRLEEAIKIAPDKAPPLVVSDGTLQKKESTGTRMTRTSDGKIEEKEKTVTYYELDVSLNNAWLMIQTGAPGIVYDHTSLWYVNTDRAFSTDKMTQINPGDPLPKAAKGKLKLTLADAVARADGFFTAAGIKDVKFFASYLVDDHGTGHVDDNWDPASHYAYKLYYTRTLNGAPVSCHESDTSGGEFNMPWFYESIEFLIADNGILEIKWDEPCAVSEMVTEDTDIIDFDTAVKAFEKAVQYTYGAYVEGNKDAKRTISVSVDSIRLNLVRLRERNKPDEKAGLYVPAYVFYGAVKEKTKYTKEKYTYEGYMTSKGSGNDFYPGPFMVMAINAVDGSVINTMDVT